MKDKKKIAAINLFLFLLQEVIYKVVQFAIRTIIYIVLFKKKYCCFDYLELKVTEDCLKWYMCFSKFCSCSYMNTRNIPLHENFQEEDRKHWNNYVLIVVSTDHCITEFWLPNKAKWNCSHCISAKTTKYIQTLTNTYMKDSFRKVYFQNCLKWL